MSQPLAQPPLSFSSLQSAPANTSYVNENLSADDAPSKDANDLKLPPNDTSNGSCSRNVPNQFSYQIPYSNPPPPPPLYSEMPPGMQQMQMQMQLPPPPPGFGPMSTSTMQPGLGGVVYYQPNAAAGYNNGFNMVMLQQGVMMGGTPPPFIIPWPNLVIGTHTRRLSLLLSLLMYRLL